MKDLVENVGIPERYIDEVLDESEWNWDIPWDKVNDEIEKRREHSIVYLKRELGVMKE